MKIRNIVLTIALLFISSAAFAQTAIPAGDAGTTYPGSFWLVLGDSSPAEHGNIQLNSYIEQGVTAYQHGRFSLVPYASFGVNTDTYGYDWNNSLKTSGGIKANIALPHGIVSLGAAYTAEDRFKSGTVSASPGYYISDWFGWVAKKYPGSTWAILGKVSPVENGNLIFNSYAQQGVVVGKIGPFKVVPFGSVTSSKDSAGYFWNNYVRPGGGVDFVLPRGLEFEALYLHEIHPGQGLSTGEFSLTVKYWHGWHFKGGN